MSETAKSARAAMKAKAQRLGGKDRPLEKVDSSSWTPPEMLNADVKTGLRPLSRRAYKSGGKVKGDAAKARADRPKRKNGGSALTADSLINRNVKSANAEREGAGKHVGGFKKGGRAEKCGGGEMKRGKYANRGGVPETSPKHPMNKDYSTRSVTDDKGRQVTSDELINNTPPTPPSRPVPTPPERPSNLKKGGRAGKFMGGPLMQPGGLLAGQQTAPTAESNSNYKDPSQSDYLGLGPDNKMANIKPFSGILQNANRMVYNNMRGLSGGLSGDVNHKSGGRIKSRSKKFMGGPLMQPGGLIAGAAPAAGPSGMPTGAGMPGTTPAPIDPRLGIVSKNAMNFSGAQGSPYKKGGAVKHPDVAEDKALIKKMVKGTALKRKEGGKVFSGEGYPHKVPGADGGRTARAAGGRTKGKTNINIVIAAGKGQQPGMPPAGGLMPPPPPAGGGRPVTVPPPPPSGAGAAPMPMPIPMPMPMGGAGAPTGAPPMPRKAGGRITKVAKSYKDMEAGAGSGEGRLQKTDIAKRTMHNKGGKVGHRNYRNYEDMDAGAGGGFGRLEKTEIAKKGTGIQKAY